MKIRILSSACNDPARGRDFYAQQGEGLGSYFLDSFFPDIDLLMLYAGIHRLLSKWFPYAIYYQVETGNELIVYRVLDCRQDPQKIQSVLRKS